MQRPLLSPLQRVRVSVACLKHRSLTFLRIIYSSLACAITIFGGHFLASHLIDPAGSPPVVTAETIGLVILLISLLLLLGALAERIGAPVSRALMKQEVETLLDNTNGE